MRAVSEMAELGAWERAAEQLREFRVHLEAYELYGRGWAEPGYR
ncbi:hypothetical protein [Streptomyces sp. NPDC007856]